MVGKLALWTWTTGVVLFFIVTIVAMSTEDKMAHIPLIGAIVMAVGIMVVGIGLKVFG